MALVKKTVKKAAPKTVKSVKTESSVKAVKKTAKKAAPKATETAPAKKTAPKAADEAPVKKAVKKSAPAKKAAPAKKEAAVKKAADTKKIMLVNVRIAAEDKKRLQAAAKKAKQSFQEFASEALANRRAGIPAKKPMTRKKITPLDAVITCRMSVPQKKKLLAEAKAAKLSISSYIISTLFGNY